PAYRGRGIGRNEHGQPSSDGRGHPRTHQHQQEQLVPANLMGQLYRTAAFVGLTTALGVNVAMYAQQNRSAIASNVAASVTTEVLRRASGVNDPLPGAWLSYGRTQGETRYSTLKQIDTTNAKRLGLAWSYVMGAGGGNQEGTPLMWNNTLYGITSWSVVF